jgi:hypothetical protein
MDPTRVTAAVPTPSHPLQILHLGDQEPTADCRSVGMTPLWAQQLLSRQEPKNKASFASKHTRKADPCLCHLNLRLRWLCYPRPQEHGSGICKPRSEKIDCSRATLRNRLPRVLAFGRPRRFASVRRWWWIVVCKRRRSQTTQCDNCQQPFPIFLVHVILPISAR